MINEYIILEIRLHKQQWIMMQRFYKVISRWELQKAIALHHYPLLNISINEYKYKWPGGGIEGSFLPPPHGNPCYITRALNVKKKNICFLLWHTVIKSLREALAILFKDFVACRAYILCANETDWSLMKTFTSFWRTEKPDKSKKEKKSKIENDVRKTVDISYLWQINPRHMIAYYFIE